ncbi:MAG: ATP-binding protein [Desulfitobacteriaceae bacterium]|nr:ATP-binding protein [Desulfitobacteriaceae bacterium]
MQNNNHIQEELEKKVKELGFLVKINNIVGFLPLELKETLSAVTKEINKQFVGNTSFIFLFSQEDQKMEMRTDDTPVCAHPNRFHRKEDIYECRVNIDTLPVIVQDITQEQGCTNRLVASDTKSYVCIPIVFGKQFLGSLTVESPRINGFNRDDLQLLIAVTSQLAFPIYRTRQYQQLENEKRKIAQANLEINQLNVQLKNKLKQLREAEALLVQSEKMAVTGRMAANLAHEINNPIGIILSSLDYLLMEPQENGRCAELEEELRVISKHARRIAALVRDLLMFARDSSHDLLSVNLADIIDKTVSVMGSQLAKDGVQVHTRLNSKEIMVKGNQMKLQQVFFNLLENSRDAMPVGGVIKVEADIIDSETMAIVMVTDTGTGICKENIEKIFDPFFTTKEAGKGTGLGLSIVYNIIREHHGTLSVTSIPGEKTVFTMRLPLYK